MEKNTQVRPWYKEFWPWFLISLLAASVMFSLTFLFFSIRYYDGSIAEDYYKDGLAINSQLAKQKHAQSLGLQASLLADPQTGDIVIDLAGERRPDQLVLDLIFPTDDDRDQTLVLEHVREGRYITSIDAPLRYRWYLHLQPETGNDSEWRLTGEATFPTSDTISLTPGI
ncbi:FixH family protein [Halomonas halocynthiae]|uniref:FixH family protein n=1 Tax=Halomonas halocynthiae TaxID=176290 RepID=UPI0003F7FAEC|nr:FixH family protein [Halomonas halocynthiae]